MRIGFIGCGNMGTALIRGMINSQYLTPEQICVYDIDQQKMTGMQNKYNITLCNNNFDVIDHSDYVILAVKPNIIDSVGQEIKDFLEGKVVISIAAGRSIASLEMTIGANRAIVRVMPNTPVLVNEGAFAVAFNESISSDKKKQVLDLFNACGFTIETEDKYMDAITGLSGSGPAYVFMMIEAMADGAVRSGLQREVALKLAAKTVMGASRMVFESKYHPGKLKDMVTSPAGTTIEGVATLENKGFRGAVIEAVYQGYLKAKEMS